MSRQADSKEVRQERSERAAVLQEEIVPTLEPEEHFFNEEKPRRYLVHEQPAHVQMVHLKVMGKTNREIAVLLDYTEDQVGLVMRQPYARKRLLQLLGETSDNYLTMLETEAKASLLTLAEVRDDRESPASARVAASNSIMDRFFGKASQKVEVYDGGKVPGLAEVDKLNAEIGKMEAEIKQLENRR